MYASHGSPNEIATLIAAMVNNAAFDPRVTSWPSVNVVIRDSDGTVLRDTVHV
jgi:hypothetical protein